MLQTELVAVQAELAAYERAAALRPVTKKRSSTARGGKPKGAISKAWKDTLAELYAWGRQYPYAEIQACYEHVNSSELAIASVRDRVRSLVDTGYMAGDPDQGFSVTETAARKFKFQKLEEAPDATAPEASSSEGPVGRESGYPPSAPEGSTPSGSTFADRVYRGYDDLEDDIPF